MEKLFIGPWNLDPFWIGKRFDVEKFIRDAEAGRYDGSEPAFLSRRELWC